MGKIYLFAFDEQIDNSYMLCLTPSSDHWFTTKHNNKCCRDKLQRCEVAGLNRTQVGWWCLLQLSWSNLRHLVLKQKACRLFLQPIALYWSQLVKSKWPQTQNCTYCSRCSIPAKLSVSVLNVCQCCSLYMLMHLRHTHFNGLINCRCYLYHCGVLIMNTAHLMLVLFLFRHFITPTNATVASISLPLSSFIF